MPVATACGVYNKRDDAGTLIPELVEFSHQQEQLAAFLNRRSFLGQFLRGGNILPKD
jgi:hypothetical protein